MATRQQTNHSKFARSLWLLPAGSALVSAGSVKKKKERENQSTIRSVLPSFTRAAEAFGTALGRKLAEDNVPNSVVEADDAESEKPGEVGG